MRLGRDQALLLGLKTVRMLAYGLTTIILVPFFTSIGSSDKEIGSFMTLTLVGDVVLSTLVTTYADRAGRRTMLCLSSILMLLSGVAFVFSSNYWVLLFAAIFGVISPSGDEVGPFRAIEESLLAHITPFSQRHVIFAYQNLLGTLGLAFGSLSGGWAADYFTWHIGRENGAYRVIFFCYTMLALISWVTCIALTDKTEFQEALDVEAVEASEPRNYADEQLANDDAEDTPLLSNPSSEAELQRRSKVQTKQLPFVLCLLFGIDSLAYGFMSNSWLVEYFLRTFKASSSLVGSFFFASSFISALTSLPSAGMTKAIGPILSISITKFGAGLFGAAVPLLGWNLWYGMSLVLLRSLFDTMDVVPRQVFVTSVVSAKDRTRVLGLINVIKTLARAIGPEFTGLLASRGHLGWCFYIMGGLEGIFATVVLFAFL